MLYYILIKLPTHLGEGLALRDEVEQLRNHLAALLRVELRVMEAAGLLQDEALLDAVERARLVRPCRHKMKI